MDGPSHNVPLARKHCPNVCMKERFVQAFLISAGLILAVTALGKAIPLPHFKCDPPPILGPYQPDVSNQTSYSSLPGYSLEFSD